jgi:acetyl-CoA C-acetyltransferase
MTRRVLGLNDDFVPTVTGGLSFFGAPLNNYMTHATCAMVRHLRAGRAESGLLYGQGEFVTKHHALFIARHAPKIPLQIHYNLQHEVDRRRGLVPPLLTTYRGSCTVETHTVIYDRSGEPQHGIVIARTTNGERIMARVLASDTNAIDLLSDCKRSPIGQTGRIRVEGELLICEF